MPCTTIPPITSLLKIIFGELLIPTPLKCIFFIFLMTLLWVWLITFQSKISLLIKFH